MKKALSIFLWFILLMLVWAFAGQMVSAPNDILVALGMIIWVVFIVLTYKTKCLTDLPKLTWRHK